MAIEHLRQLVLSSTTKVMGCVLLAMLPGVLASLSIWGLGILWNLAWGVTLCVAVEFVCSLGKGIAHAKNNIGDLSAVVTGAILALCLPPFASIYLLLLASLAAVGLTKHAYGGLGRNIFNPAMVGFAVILVSFPETLTTWPSIGQVDGLTGATQLSDFRYREGMTVTEFDITYESVISAQSNIAILFAMGGIGLIVLRIISWHIPVGCLIGLALASLFGYDQGSSLSHGSLVFHALSGGFAFAMFFVATDPVTHPTATRDQVIFGIIIGLVTYLIRAFGVYPDGIAFAVLFANCFTAFLNRMRVHQSKAKGHA